MNATYQPTERRPLKSRGLPMFGRLAKWLARSGVTPNAISVAGMVSGLAAGSVLALTAADPERQRLWWLLAGLLIQLRLLANMLDGMVAIEAGLASPVGELYNEVPDRVSDAAALTGAGYALGGDATLGYLATCAALFTAYVRAMGRAAGAPQEFCGPMAKPQRMFVLTCVCAYCGLAPMTWQPTWGAMNADGVAAAALVLIIGGCLLTSIRRLLRIAANLRKGER